MADFHNQGNLETYLLTIMNMVSTQTKRNWDIYHLKDFLIVITIANLSICLGIFVVHGSVNRQLHQSGCCQNHSGWRDRCSKRTPGVNKCWFNAGVVLQMATRSKPWWRQEPSSSRRGHSGHQKRYLQSTQQPLQVIAFYLFIFIYQAIFQDRFFEFFNCLVMEWYYIHLIRSGLLVKDIDIIIGREIRLLWFWEITF